MGVVTKTKLLRVGVAAAGILVVVSGVVQGGFHYGGLDSLSIGDLVFTCPLGFLERSLAARELLPEWQSALLVLGIMVVLGRIFCAWFCPTVLLRRVFRLKRDLNPMRQATTRPGINWAAYGPYAVLVGTLAASFVLRFPVFCFFCPVGLFFGAVYAVLKLFTPFPFSVELILFPALLALELWGLRSWCRSLCPLGALLSLAGSFNRLLVPTVNQDKCLLEKGVNCQACQRVCPEGIDLAQPKPLIMSNSCTKCMECSDRCPVKAIHFPIANLTVRTRQAVKPLAPQH